MKNGRGVVVSVVLMLLGFGVLTGEYLIHKEFHLAATLLAFVSVFWGALRLDPVEGAKALSALKDTVWSFWSSRK